MSDVPPRLQGPRHLTNGWFYARRELAACLVRWIPVGLYLVTLLASWFGLGLVGLVMAVGFAVTAWITWPPVRRYVQAAVWRSRWWWDVRGLLGINAEWSASGSDTGTVDVGHVVVVPYVRSIRVLPDGRRYIVRPLPTQIIGHFVGCAPHLAQVWGPATVTVDFAPNGKDIAVTVVRGLPSSKGWTT